MAAFRVSRKNTRSVSPSASNIAVSTEGTATVGDRETGGFETTGQVGEALKTKDAPLWSLELPPPGTSSPKSCS